MPLSLPFRDPDEPGAALSWPEWCAHLARQRAEVAVAEAIGTEALSADILAQLATIRQRRDAGGYPDDTVAHFNAHRLAFVRWLVTHGYLTESL